MSATWEHSVRSVTNLRPLFTNTRIPAAQRQPQGKSAQQETRNGADDQPTKHQSLSRTIAGAHVTFQEGTAVSGVSLPSDYSILTLTNLPIQLGEKDIRDLLECWTDHASIESVVTRLDPQTSTKSAHVKVADRGRTRKAVLNGESSLEVHDSTVTVRTVQVGESGLGTNRLKLSTVACSWNEPSMRAELKYRTATEARELLLDQSEDPRELHGRRLTLARGHSASVIEVRNLAVQTTEVDLYRHFHRSPPSMVVLGRISHSQSSMEFRDNVKTLLEKCGKLVEWSVSNKPGSASTTAFGTFSNLDAPLWAVQKLDEKRIDPLSNDKLHVRHVVSVKLPVSQRVLHAITPQLQLLTKTAQSTLAVFVSMYDNSTKTYTQIKLSGGDRTSVSQVKMQVERLLAGKVATVGTQALTEPFFFQITSLSYLGQIMDSHGVHIVVDQGRTVLRLYGEAQSVGAAEAALLHKAQQLKHGPKAIVRIDQRADSLEAFADLIIEDNEQSNCSVCLTPAEDPFTTRCGHLYCKECLISQTASIPDFPFRWLGLSGNCNEPLTLQDLRGVLPASEFDALLISSLMKHIRTQPADFQYCPTPECDRFYRTSSPENFMIFDCDRCLSSVYTACHGNPHEDQTCAEAKAGAEAFQRWREENDVRDCPSCRMPIQKTEGCNHVQCASCNSHMCWMCMQTFKTGLEVYGHMTEQHNGHWGVLMDRDAGEKEEEEER
jgi:LSD1 subclass zinc finger protein